MALRLLRRERALPARVVVDASDAAALGTSRVTELHELSALEIAALVARREISPVETVRASLARAEAAAPALNATAWLRHEAALADARTAEKRLAGGEEARPLEGVPFTVKELCAIADGPSEQGSRAYEGFRFGVDAFVVQRLKEAGAILVATTTSSELGNRPTTESDLHGVTRNPWDPARTAGGSSGGAAVSAAVGIAPLNHGSDGGGSLRIPAACCGVFGLKPQRARISLGPVLSEEWGGLDVYGPITRTVGDAAVFLDVTAGPARGDPYWAPPPARSFLSSLDEGRPLRIAVAFERDGERVDPECVQAVRATADVLRALGHDVEEDQPHLLPLEQPFLMVSTVGIGAAPLEDEQRARLEERTRLIFDVALEIPAFEYVHALDEMHRHSRVVAAFFERYDALLTPTLSRPAPPIGTIGGDTEHAWEDYRNWLCWTWPWNATGQPAASVPSGMSAEGLPIGVQLVGAAGEERTILSLSAALERARPWPAADIPI